MKRMYVVGAGSYVIGDSFGMGVILPSLLEMARRVSVSEIILIVRSKRNGQFWERVQKIHSNMASSVSVKEVVIAGSNDLSTLDLTECAAFIAVPDDSHHEYAKVFLSHSVPVWIVKPLTGDGHQSYELAKLAYETKTPLWVDYHKRFDTSNQKLRQIVKGNDYGHLHIYSVQYSQPWTIPLQDLAVWANNVDVFQYIGCHYIDQIFYLFPDAVPKRISSTGFEGTLRSKGGPKYDLVNTSIDFELASGRIVRGVFVVGWNDPPGSTSKSHQRIDLQFETGRIIADQKVRGFQLWESRKTEEINPYFFQMLDSLDGKGVGPSGYGFESIKEFFNCLGAPVRFSDKRLPWGWNSYKTDFVLDASKKSLDLSGEWVAVDFPELPL
ncbi:MAG: hypothetical protein WCX28_12000 [Bacteriovoracaceae bacterium]|nr:hypothetical protein [Bacteroidota bacterium]